MPPSDPITDSTPDYRLLRVLIPDRTFLCVDESEHVVVLKRLDDDCLHRNQLHPRIHDRLVKVRELAHPRVATLRTVERWGGNACLVWVYLAGQPWETAIADSSADVAGLCKSLVTAVEMLHECGIVHGNLHGRNIIVVPKGEVWLTNVSPYLYSNPKDDLDAIVKLIPCNASQEITPSVTLALGAGQHRLPSYLQQHFLCF